MNGEQPPMQIAHALRTVAILREACNFPQALAELEDALRRNPEHPALLLQRAEILFLSGKTVEALTQARHLCAITPDNVDALILAGRLLLALPGGNEAAVHLRRAYELRPSAACAVLLAQAYEKDAAHAQGLPFCRAALESFSDNWQIMCACANLYADSGALALGLPLAERARGLAPQEFAPRLAQAAILKKMHRPWEALELLTGLTPTGAQRINFLSERSQLYRDLGRTPEALADLQDIFRSDPRLMPLRSNFLLYLHDLPDLAPEELFRAHRQFGADFAPIPQPPPALPRSGAHGGRLHIGFVSGDLRRHSICYFLRPLLAHLPRPEFHLTLFSNNDFNDEVSLELFALADDVCPVRSLSDAQAAEVVRARRIDILLDLSGHTGNNRLGVFLHRPAPVQITWLGYPDTTGLAQMDYRIVDAITDPTPEADALCTERLLRLPGTFICYAPPKDAPEVAPSPCIANGYITFGSFNNPAKISPALLRLWGAILSDCPDSRLLIKSGAFADRRGREHLLRGLGDICADRLITPARTSEVHDHLGFYDKVDIALDTFPYNGTTTTCEALHMGVPVVTLAGRTHCSRVGSSLLGAVGLPQLIATEAQGYRRIALALAAQREDLVRLRAGMRLRLAQSPLGNAPEFAARFAALLREANSNPPRNK